MAGTAYHVPGKDANKTVCGRPIEVNGRPQVLLTTNVGGKKATTVCGRCKALKAGQARTEKIQKKHERIRAAGKSPIAEPLKDVRKLNKAIKRQPALAILGEKMPHHLQVTFKGVTTSAKVLHDPKDPAVHGRIMLLEPDGTPYGDSYGSPSRAGKAIAGREIDGWTFWSYLKANGELEKIDALRKEVA
ncbi:MAG: hypothetical protein A2Z40_04280 [Deltaproteobacteria bacterium RBG_19FT_COMBO_60_16]|nr:MAG: hypothetical protein A2Z40_04280 [Deltaproteobacteria bacterium RBG_19FT_COMBO_60_16]